MYQDFQFLAHKLLFRQYFTDVTVESPDGTPSLDLIATSQLINWKLGSGAQRAYFLLRALYNFPWDRGT